MIDHDRLFKELVTTFFADFVELFLPELFAYLDASSIEFIDKELTQMNLTLEERPRVKLECLRLLTTLRLDPARMKLIGGFIDTYLRLNPDELLLFEREADTVLSTNERSKMLEITTSWEEKGRQDECRRMVRRLLQRRLGSVDTGLQAELDALSTEQLEALAEALLDLTSVAGLRTWLTGIRTTP